MHAPKLLGTFTWDKEEWGTKLSNGGHVLPKFVCTPAPAQPCPTTSTLSYHCFRDRSFVV